MRVEKDLVVNAPVARVYELWTDFEHFPRFMAHIEEVRRTGDNLLHWKAKLGPVPVEWDAEIKALVPNRTVTWHSTEGAENAGAVTLAEKGHITEMHVVIEYSTNLLGTVAEMITGELRRSVEQDLERFRALAEGRDVEAGEGHSAGKIGAMAEQVSGTLGLGKDKDDADSGSQASSMSSSSTSGSSTSGGSSMSSSTGSGSTSGSSTSAGGSGMSGSSTSGGGSMSGSSMGSSGMSGAAEPLQRDTAVAGWNIEAAPDETAGTNTPSAVERADERGTLYNMSNLDATTPARNVEVEGLGSDESPGQAVGSTSPEEIAAARDALGGTPTTGTSNTTSTGATGSWNRNMDEVVSGAAGGAANRRDTDPGGQMSGRSSVPAAGEMGLSAGENTPGDARSRAGTDFMSDAAADENTQMDSMAGVPGNPGSDAGGLPGVQPTRGGVNESAPGVPATDVTPAAEGGSIGPSLMTYEPGTGPDVPSTSRSDTGTMADDRTNLGGTSVSSGSMTDTGRARYTSGMAGDVSGYTTASDSSLAGQGDLGGGPDDVGGRATIPDLGHTPQGGGTGRGEGGAYGSSITQSGGPHSYAMPMDAMAEGENTMGADTATGGMPGSGATGPSDASRPAPDRAPTDRGDMVIATNPRDLGSTEDTEGTDRGDMVIATGAQPRDLSPSPDQDATDRGDMVIATNPRDLDAGDTEPAPIDDPTVGGTGANYSGGTGGWGTEDPNSSEVIGWTPSSIDPDRRGGGGETH
jgi:uncharacterized protein YndB with AHSA1/START domain